MLSVCPELCAFLPHVLVRCLDIRAVWSTGHADAAFTSPEASRELLVFADRLTLETLRKSHDLQRADLELRVVFDGDQFESVWGTPRVCGSLARWAWRQVAPGVAYYDEARWASPEAEGRVIRIRRKALLIWEASGARARAA